MQHSLLRSRASGARSAQEAATFRPPHITSIQYMGGAAGPSGEASRVARGLFSGISPKPAVAQSATPPPLGQPVPCHSVLALDIDGTITTADPRVVDELVRAARDVGSHVYAAARLADIRDCSFCTVPVAASSTPLGLSSTATTLTS